MPSTPMMQQYQEAKASVGDAILLFRMGDFYELFYDDAKIAAGTLGLTLTSRDKGENPIPMAGFPHHQLNGYLAKIIAAGHRAAICEQVEDPQLAKGLVKREVTRIVSRGTVIDDALLDPRANNFLAALVLQGSKDSPRERAFAGRGSRPQIGLAWVDLSTGRFWAAAFASQELADQLARISPSECLVSDTEQWPATVDPLVEMTVTRRAPWAFARQAAFDALVRHFGTVTLEGFGFRDSDPGDILAVRAAGAILDYLTETQRTSLSHIDQLIRWTAGETLQVDPATRRSLEITQTLRYARREGSMLDVIDRTVTAMGSRQLAEWVAAPLATLRPLEARHEAVAELVQEELLTRDVRDTLRSIYDMERLLARISTGHASPRDLSLVGRTLASLPKLKAHLVGRQCILLRNLDERMDLCPSIRAELDRALEDECPLASREGGIIRAGYHQQLDQLRSLCTGGKKWMTEYQAEQVRRTGISNLKVGFNKVFGYFLEVTHAHQDKVPHDYTRKQTLKNAERYITAELKDYEEQVLSADERSKQLEYELFVKLREMVAEAARRLRATAEAIAQLDVLSALADLARSRNYVRPEMVSEPILLVEDGRHPVLDITEPEGTFVPNGIDIAGKSGATRVVCNDESLSRPDTGDTSCATSACLLLITGPNMAGKSTYIRQAALITLLAQIGSFVPARKATIGVADRIFARVGASDELSRGQSTFMVEMTETARILNSATPRSLVILDEIGRGTSTYDGLSLAWSIVEYLHDRIGCRTLFATHYHELTVLAEDLSGAQNSNVAAREWNEEVVFLHQVVPGAADKSYGIHVAQIAGVPKEVNRRARQVLSWLESQHSSPQDRNALTVEDQNLAQHNHDSVPQDRIVASNGQLCLFDREEHPLLDEIRSANLAETTPIEALQMLDRWQRSLQNVKNCDR